MSDIIFHPLIAAYIVILCLLSIPLGIIIGRRFLHFDEGRGEQSWVHWILGEASAREMSWQLYAGSLFLFHILGGLFLTILLCFQHRLPLNPQHIHGMPFDLALNTAISFITNTNWQAYSGESTLSYFSQMVGLGVQNFLSAATGIAVLLALARALRRREIITIGNFWLDIMRATLFILVPLSFVFALILIQQGVPQTFSPYITVHTLEGLQQLIPLGPVASQVAIKQLGTNGGGFFGVNSAHPFENPTSLTNFLQLISILLIPSALVFSFGILIKNMRHAISLWAVMFFIFITGLFVALYFQSQGNSAIAGLSFWEGVETRFGIASSTLWGVATTAASNGSVNAMHSSFSPLAGFVAMFNMLLGEIIFGGVGSGVYGMVLFAILTVFLAGLMVGRTPEYLGRKIGGSDIIYASVGVFTPCVLVLVGTAVAVFSRAGSSSISSSGPHGLSEVLYAFGSVANNNGSAFGGLNSNTPFYNYIFSLCMLVGRFGVIFPVLAIAGSLARKKVAAISDGSFPMHGGLFAIFLTFVIVIVGALTFFPVLALGPIAEHLLMLQGRLF